MAAAGTWYPNYPAGWEAGKCINILLLPPMAVGRCMQRSSNAAWLRLLDRQITYVSQTWMGRPPVCMALTKMLPLPPGYVSYFASKEECCQGTYANWAPPKAENCISASIESPTSKPTTSKPTETPMS
jgi:hypothetical protein